MHPPPAHPTVPPSTERGIGAEEFNVGQFLVNRASPVQLPAEAGINQYGSMFQHVANPQCDSGDEDDTPPLRDAHRHRPSSRVSPVCQPLPMDEDIERHEDADVQGGQLVPFNSQAMDVAPNHPIRLPPSPDAIDRSNAPVDEEITVVTAPVEGRIVINVSDVESYGTGRHLLGDSLDGNSNDDNEGVSHGVEMPSTPEPRPMEVDAPSTTSTGAGPASTSAEDDFYNAVGKASHLDSIVPKQESGWWAAHKEWKRRKA